MFKNDESEIIEVLLPSLHGADMGITTENNKHIIETYIFDSIQTIWKKLRASKIWCEINITNSCKLNGWNKVLILADYAEFVNDIHEFNLLRHGLFVPVYFVHPPALV